MTVVLMTAHGSINSAVEAIKLGAYDYLQKPFEFSELQRFMDKVREHRRLRAEVKELKESTVAQEGVRTFGDAQREDEEHHRPRHEGGGQQHFGARGGRERDRQRASCPSYP